MTILIKTTIYFEKKIRSFLSEEEKEELYDHLVSDPEKGDLIPGGGGIRKLRWKNPKNTKGKSGGLRIIYYYKKGVLVILLSVYEKSSKENLTKEETNKIRKLIPRLLEE